MVLSLIYIYIYIYIYIVSLTTPLNFLFSLYIYSVYSVRYTVVSLTTPLNFLFGGLHEKHAVQRGIWVPTQHLLWDQGKLRKTLIELDLTFI
jgi:hypothetical protein